MLTEPLLIFLCPTAKILIVDTATQMEVCFICHNNTVEQNSDQMLSYRATVCHVTIA
jgi:hypothetical protein